MGKKINIVLMIAWMIIIFMFSQQPGSISNDNNRFVVELLKRVNIDLNKDFGNLCDFIIRKSAHFAEYFILYILSLNVLRDINKKNRYNFIYALAVVFVYACTDEFHQLFVIGREGRFRDVMIDTTGGAVSMAISFIKINFINKKSIYIDKSIT